MSQYEIVVTLFTIVYGLMLTDLFASLHKLIRAGNIVKWHWLPLLAAWYIFLLIIKNWWDLTFSDGASNWTNIYFFVAYGHLLVLLYLVVSAALPDKIQKEGINLKKYYFQNHSYFWGVMSAVGLMSIMISLISGMLKGTPLNIHNIVANCIFISLTILLAISKKYWFHSVAIIFFVIATVLEIIMSA